jgi:hypothetical protein
MEEKRDAYMLLVVGRGRGMWVDNIKIYLREIG